MSDDVQQVIGALRHLKVSCLMDGNCPRRHPQYPGRWCHYCLMQRAATLLEQQTARESAMRDALQQLAKADLNEDNCASWGVANRRIRAIANRGLTSTVHKGEG